VIGHLQWLCFRHGIPWTEYDPKDVKRALAGFSGADKKDQVAAARKIGLSLCEGPAQDDEADSFGVWLALLRDKDRRLGERWDRLLYGRRGALL
jgi:Holliday junction resolvasome RuvABC endonuclease subunit